MYSKYLNKLMDRLQKNDVNRSLLLVYIYYLLICDFPMMFLTFFVVAKHYDVGCCADSSISGLVSATLKKQRLAKKKIGS